MLPYNARLVERAKEQLLHWEREVKLDNQRGLTDINKAAENFYRGLLNIILDSELINMNLMKMDFPAVDLAERNGGLCVQVTSSEGRDKINHTLEEFFGNDLQKTYQRLIVVIIGTKPKYNKTPFPTEDGFVLDRDSDIWDTAGLLQQIEGLDGDRLKRVDEYLTRELGEIREPVLHLPVPERRNPVGFLGRKTELAWIGDELKKGTKPVVIAGLGGVGKTALAVEFRKGWRGQVYFVRFDTSFTRTLADSVGMAIPPQERRGLNEEQTAELALSYLRRCEPGDLLIVDNAEVTGKSWAELTRDPFYEKLRRLPMAVLMTTRHRDTGGRWLGRLDQEDLREIFRRHEVNISEGEMDELIEAVDGHTMTVDMIARTIRESWGDVTAETILTAMETSTLHAGDFDDIENDHDPEQGKIYAHLRALFDLSRISEDGRQALRCATLLPQTGMDEALFRHALPDGAAKEIKKLEKKGWVDRKEGMVTIHPVVRLVCRTELEPTDGNCEEFLDGIDNQYDPKRYDHVKFRQMAELFENASITLEDETGVLANQVGFLWNQVAEPQRALSYNLRAVEKQEQHQPDSNSLAASYNNVGYTYGVMGDHEKALEYKLKALAIWERVLTEDHPDLALSCNNVGMTYGAQGDYQRALEYLLKALTIWEQVLPEEHPDLARSLNNVGSTYGDLGEYQRALEYLLKALTIWEQVLPEEHPDLARSFNNVGMTYGALGDHEKALEYNLKALAIWERVLPENHPDLALSCNNVGMTYEDLDDHEKALEYNLKALAIRERVLPGNHPDLARSFNNIAWTYYRLGRLEEAAVHMRRAAEIINRSTLPEHHPHRVNFNKWADEMEEEARQARGGDDPTPVSS